MNITKKSIKPFLLKKKKLTTKIIERKFKKAIKKFVHSASKINITDATKENTM